MNAATSVRTVLVSLSVAALLWLAAAAVLFGSGTLDLDAVKLHLLLATALWFLVTPWWLLRERA